MEEESCKGNRGRAWDEDQHKGIDLCSKVIARGRNETVSDQSYLCVVMLFLCIYV